MAEETSASQAPADIVVLGKVVEAYGLRGAVKVHAFADDPRSWGAVSHWWFGRDEDPPALWRRVRLIRCREQSGVLIATLSGVSDRNASESMRGLLIGMPRAALPATESSEYYWADLIGLEVVNQRDQSLGRVTGLIETAANDVMRVDDGLGSERLLPFVASVVLDVDVSSQRIRVDWEADW